MVHVPVVVVMMMVKEMKMVVVMMLMAGIILSKFYLCTKVKKIIQFI